MAPWCPRWQRAWPLTCTARACSTASKTRKLMSGLAELVVRAGQTLGVPNAFVVVRAFSNPNSRVKDAVLTHLEKVRATS